MLPQGAFIFLHQAEDEEERRKTETYKLLASEQKTSLNLLYHERNRPQLESEVSVKHKVDKVATVKRFCANGEVKH